jgi:hypothetical protein
MANTLTNLSPDLYEALDIVSRELVGFIPSATLDSGVERAAVGQTVRSFVAPASVASDITPAVTAPNDGDQVIGNEVITISKSRGVPFRWNGEEQKGVNHGPGYSAIRLNQITQAMRTLTNEIEADAAATFIRASRAFGTAGTTPFASDLSDTAQIRKILSDNGAPVAGGWNAVFDTTAGAKMRTLAQLTKANEGGETSLLRQGELVNIHGGSLRESAQVKAHTKGTGTSYTSDTAGYAVGDTVITLITGTGNVEVGDVATFAGDANKYVVSLGTVGAGPITIAAPGLREPIAASAVAMTIGADYTANLAFTPDALVIATRVPERPEEGDQADDVMMITDPRSGLTFEIALYKQYRQVRYELSAAWGQALVKPEHSAILLG